MPVEVRVPALGESVVEATVGAWLKHEGDQVQAGEPLVQLETEKVNLDVSAERDGLLARIQRQEGETVQPGDVLATLEEAAAARPGQAAVAQPAAGEPPPQVAPPAETLQPAAETERPHASPVARRMAEEHGLDLTGVEGTGTGGRVTREDVERHLARGDGAAIGGSSAAAIGGAAGAPPARPAAGAVGAPAPTPTVPTEQRREERIRMSRRRQTIAQRLLEAQRTAAMLTTFNEVDMSAVIDLRAQRRDAFQQRHGVSLGFMSFFAKAAIAALKAFPNVNAEIQGDEIVRKLYYDIGIAVGAEGGLVVPVVRDADRKTFAEIERTIAELAEKARTNTLTLEDLRGGTFTITNGGVFGSLLSTPILSPPQVGILGMHRIQPRPVAVDGQVVIRPMMYLALTYDHRIVDGREAVQFLVHVKQLIEDPTALLLDS